MKKIALFSLAALMMLACSKDDEPGGMTEAGQQTLKLRGCIEAVTDVAAPATRGNVQSTMIVENEIVYGWVSDGSEEDPKYYVKLLSSQPGGALSGAEPIYFPQKSGKVDIRALHGKLDDKSKPKIEYAPTKFTGNYVFSVNNDQSNVDAYVQSDLLYAEANGVESEGATTTVPLTFYHMLGKVELQLEKTAGVSEEITSVTVSDVIVGGTFKPGAGSDLTQQAERAKMIQSDGSTGKMTFGTALHIDGVTNDAIVVPQDLSDKIVTIELAGGDKKYTLTRKLESGTWVKSGQRTVLYVKVQNGNFEISSSIKPWEDTDEQELEAVNPLPPRKGDFFYADGTYSTELNLHKTPIGIVFQTNLDRIGKAEKDALKNKGVGKPHGLVMALKNAGAGTMTWCTSAILNPGDGTSADRSELINCTSNKVRYANISGLDNYNKVIAAAEKAGNLSDYPAFEAVKHFDVQAPAKTTGWFLPSVGQLYDFFHQLYGEEMIAEDYDYSYATDSKNTDAAFWSVYDDFIVLNGYFPTEVSDTPFTSENLRFWSSSEGNGDSAEAWYYQNVTVSGTADYDEYEDSRIYCGHADKVSDYHYVRPILAF